MKIRTIKVLAAAGAVTLSLSGCSILAPVATDTPYGPSDGVQTSVASVDVRNVLLVGAETGAPLNPVFTTVNNTAETQHLIITFTGSDGSTAEVAYDVEPGLQKHNATAADTSTLIDLGEQEIGSTVSAYFEVNGERKQLDVPVLDGSLEDYRAYIINPDGSSNSGHSESHEHGTDEHHSEADGAQSHGESAGNHSESDENAENH